MGVVDVVERLHTAQTCRCRCLTEEFAMILNLSTVTVGLLWFLHLWLQQLYINIHMEVSYVMGGTSKIIHLKIGLSIKKTIHFGGIPIYEKPHILHIIPSPQYKKPSENHILVGGFTLIWDPKVQVLFSRGLDDPASDPATHGLLLTFPMGNPRLLANLFGDFLWIFVWPSQANPAKIQQKSTKNPPKNAPKIHQKSPNPSFIKDLRPFVLKPLGVWSAVTWGLWDSDRHGVASEYPPRKREFPNHCVDDGGVFFLPVAWLLDGWSKGGLVMFGNVEVWISRKWGAKQEREKWWWWIDGI